MKKNNQYLRDHHTSEHQSFKLGVALSGGGARGLAHAGALKAIDEAGLKIDVISGVSAGSIVAVLYAAGLKPDTILEMFKTATFFDLAELSVGKGGLLRIDKFVEFIMRCLGSIKTFEQLKIPTYIGVTNFDDAQPEVFSKGELAPVIQASCSIPVAIVPVRIGEKTYVDGGVLRNLPAWTIRKKCDKLIGISVSTVLKTKVAPTLISMALRSYSLLAKSNQAPDLELCDIPLKIDDVSRHGVFNLRELEDVYNSGYENMKNAIIANNLTTTNP